MILFLGIGSTNAQNTNSELQNLVDRINAILKENPLSYYIDTKKNSAFIKKISVNEYDIVAFTDRIPKPEITTTAHNKPKFLPDCRPEKTIRTFDLFAVEKWDVVFPQAYMKFKNNQIYGKIIGFQEPDLYKLKEQFDKLTALCRK